MGGSRSTTILLSHFCGKSFIVALDCDQFGIETSGNPRVDGGDDVNVKVLVFAGLDPTN